MKINIILITLICSISLVSSLNVNIPLPTSISSSSGNCTCSSNGSYWTTSGDQSGLTGIKQYSNGNKNVIFGGSNGAIYTNDSDGASSYYVQSSNAFGFGAGWAFEAGSNVFGNVYTSILGASNSAGDFTDYNSNEVKLADGTYAINAKGNSLFKGNVTTGKVLFIGTQNTTEPAFQENGEIRWAGGSKLIEQTSDNGSAERMLYLPRGNDFEVLTNSGSGYMSIFQYPQIILYANGNERLRVNDTGAFITGDIKSTGTGTFSYINPNITTLSWNNITDIWSLNNYSYNGNWINDNASFNESLVSNRYNANYSYGGNNFSGTGNFNGSYINALNNLTAGIATYASGYIFYSGNKFTFPSSSNTLTVNLMSTTNGIPWFTSNSALNSTTNLNFSGTTLFSPNITVSSTTYGNGYIMNSGNKYTFPAYSNTIVLSPIMTVSNVPYFGTL